MKLPKIPNFVLKTPVQVFNKDSTDGDGKPIHSLDYDGMCRKEIYNSKNYQNSGDTNNYLWVLYLNEHHGTVDGRVEVDGETFTIGKVQKHLNPDGSYHHTKLLLM